MNILKMIPHVRNAFEGTSPSVVCVPLVPEAEDALGLAQNEETHRAGGRDRGSERERPLFISSRPLPALLSERPGYIGCSCV